MPIESGESSGSSEISEDFKRGIIELVTNILSIFFGILKEFIHLLGIGLKAAFSGFVSGFSYALKNKKKFR